MKMKLFAAAVAALAASGAYAQSSVTLYGVVDAGLTYANNVPSTATASGKGSRVGLDSGGLSGSRWGLRGVEDLGGGLKGIFNLESGFTIDDGKSAQSSRLFGRSAYVGLQGQWGQLTLGRHTNLLYDFGVNFDPMSIAGRYSLGAQDYLVGSGRADNSVKYLGTFGGLGVQALYSFNRDGNEVAGQSKRGREWSLGTTYAAGPFAVGAVYDQSDIADVTLPVDNKEQRATIAGTYAFGPAKLYAGYRWYHANFATVAGNGNLRSNLYWAGLGYQVTPALSLTGAAYYQQFKNSNTGNPWLFVVGTDYALSKRTDAYFNLAYAKNSNGSGLGVLNLNSNDSYAGTTLGSTNFSSQNVASSSTLGNANQFGATVGIRHKF